MQDFTDEKIQCGRCRQVECQCGIASVGMRVIGLVGQKQHGKDTVCELIQQLLPGLSVKRFAFADALKIEVAHVCGIGVDRIDDEKARFRPMLQWWGTEFRRGQDSEYWIKQTRNAISNARFFGIDNPDVAVITDCRFLNEAALVREFGGHLIRVVRPGMELLDAHASEVELRQIGCDYEIRNEGTLEELSGYVGQCLTQLGYTL